LGNTPNRDYPIPDPAAAIHPSVRDMIMAVDADVDSLPIPTDGIYDVVSVNVSESYSVDGVRVVTEQQPPIADFADSPAAIIPNPADSPASADALRDDLVNNVLPAIKNLINSLAQKDNVIIGTMRQHGLVETVVPLDPASAPGLLRGWSSRNITSLVDGDPIASVPDVSTTNDPAVQATSGNKPSYQTNEQNGQPTIRFDGSNDYLSFTEVTTIRTAYFVMKHRTGSQDSAGFLGSPATYFDFHGGDGNKLISSTNANSSLRNGAAWVNGFEDAPINLLKSTSVRCFVFRSTGNLRASLIGSDRLTTGRYWDGDYDEVWLFDQAHTTATVKRVNQFFMQTYALEESGVLAPLLVLDGNSLMSNSLQVRINNCLAGNCAAGTPLESEFVVQNFGVSGQTTPQMIADFGSQIAPLYNPKRSKNIYVMWEATNHHYADSSVTAAQAFDSILTLCHMAQEVGFNVVIPNVLPRSNSGTPGDFATWRASFNSLLASNAAVEGYLVANLAGNSTIGDTGDETNTTYYSDLVHLTDAGNDIVAPLIATQIQAF